MSEWVIHTGTHIVVSHCRDCLIPGYMIVSLRRPVSRIAELSLVESRELLAGLAFSEQALGTLFSPERIYIMRISELNSELHFHVFPRSAELAHSYLAEQSCSVIDGSLLFGWARRRFHSASPEPTRDVQEAKALLKQAFEEYFRQS